MNLIEIYHVTNTDKHKTLELYCLKIIEKFFYFHKYTLDKLYNILSLPTLININNLFININHNILLDSVWCSFFFFLICIKLCKDLVKDQMIQVYCVLLSIRQKNKTKRKYKWNGIKLGTATRSVKYLWDFSSSTKTIFIKYARVGIN